MPLIHVDILKGRTPAMKAAFARSVTKAATDYLNVRPDQVRIILREIKAEHWYSGGISKAPPA